MSIRNTTAGEKSFDLRLNTKVMLSAMQPAILKEPDESRMANAVAKHRERLKQCGYVERVDLVFEVRNGIVVVVIVLIVVDKLPGEIVVLGFQFFNQPIVFVHVLTIIANGGLSKRCYVAFTHNSSPFAFRDSISLLV